MKKYEIKKIGFRNVLIEWVEFVPKFSRTLANFPDGAVDYICSIRLIPSGANSLEFHSAENVAFFKYNKTEAEADDKTWIYEIGLLQITCRFLAYLSLSSNILLLHGSTCATNEGLGISFLDNGHSRGKSSMAFLFAKRYGYLIVDEFSFFDLNKKQIIGGGHWPLHIRRDMFEKLGIQKLNSVDFHGTPELLKVKSEDYCGINVVVFPSVLDVPRCSVNALSFNQGVDYLISNSMDHIKKLLDPGLDRVTVFGEPEAIFWKEHKKVTIGEETKLLLESLLKDVLFVEFNVSSRENINFQCLYLYQMIRGRL